MVSQILVGAELLAIAVGEVEDDYVIDEEGEEEDLGDENELVMLDPSHVSGWGHTHAALSYMHVVKVVVCFLAPCSR